MFENIKVKGKLGTWYVIDEYTTGGTTYYLLEHEQWGDEVEGIIVNDMFELVIDEVYNGFIDLEEYFGTCEH